MQIQSPNRAFSSYSSGNPQRPRENNERKESFERGGGCFDDAKAAGVAFGIPILGAVGGAAVAGLGTGKLISMVTDNALAPWIGGVPAAVVGGSVGLFASWAAVWGKMGD